MKILHTDIDPYCCAVLRKNFPDDDVLEKDIREIQPGDVAGYGQIHWFAGIGGWALALRYAGFAGECWTASCPCQPFSAAGLARGVGDERHLWPVVRGLIADRHPPVIFGEQVASRLGYQWLAGVRADLEREGYAVGCADLPAACVGAPHIRRRVYWVADSSIVSARPAKAAVSVPVHEDPWKTSIEQTGRCCREHNKHKRRAPSGVLLVANGLSENLDRIGGLGNAIVPQVAATFVRAWMKADFQG